jgi:hypothetical protein
MLAGGQRNAPVRHFIPDNYPVPIAQEARLAPGPVWTRTESHNPFPPEFDPRTSELIVSRYTDYAIPAHWEI